MGDGKSLREIRKVKNLSIPAISRASGIPASTLYSIEQRDSRIPFMTAVKMAPVLERRPEEISSEKNPYELLAKSRIVKDEQGEDKSQELIGYVSHLNKKEQIELMEVLEKIVGLPEERRIMIKEYVDLMVEQS